MKTKYFLNLEDVVPCQLRKTNTDGHLCYYQQTTGDWRILPISNSRLERYKKYYKEITEEEAFRYILES